MGWRRGSPPGSEKPPDDGSGDAALLAHARANPHDPAAFDPIFDHLWDDLFRYAYYRLGSWEEAEDAAQTVLIAVAARLPGFSERRDGGFRAWIFAIAHNETVNRLRRRARSRDVPFPDLSPIVDRQPSPEQEALTSEGHAELRRMLAQLPPEQRAVMELRMADLTTKQIADVLGKQEVNVRSSTNARSNDCACTRSP